MSSASINSHRSTRPRVALHVCTLALLVFAVGLAGVGILRGRLVEAATTTVIVGQTNGGGPNSVNQFNSAAITITAGDTVTWNSAPDGKSHDVTSYAETVPNTPDWQSSLLKSGTSSTTFNRVFSTAGTNTYYCSLHANRDDAAPGVIDANIASGKMVGKIVVQAASTPSPSATSVTATATTTATATGTATATSTATGTSTATATATASATATATSTATTTATATPAASPTPPAPTSGDVQIIDFAYSPSSLSITPGSSVRWVNVGAKPHTVTAKDGSFDSGIMAKNDAYSRTFSTAGTYEYFCDLHPDMVANVIVAAASSSPGETPASAPPAPLPGDIHILAFDFSPKDVSVTVGTTVRWVNLVEQSHTVTARDGFSFLSPPIPRYRTFSHTFTKPGKYEYYSTGAAENVGLTMVGTITVTAPPPKPSPSPSATPPSTPGEVQMLDFDYSPRTISVKPGTSVRFVNAGIARHTVTALDGSWDSGFMAKGDAYRRTFATAGTYDYYCIIHPEMVGSVQVADEGGSATAPATPSPASTPAPPPPPPPAVGPGDVQVLDFDYSPRTITVNPGASVRFVNVGIAPHTITARDGSFDSGFMSKGDAYRHTFGAPGTFDYFCALHPNMTGSVRVLDSSGGAPPPGTITATSSPAAESVQPAGNAAAKVAMIEFGFEPRTLTVRPGTEVTWQNAGVAPHTATARDGSFDSGLVTRGASWSRRFDAAGTFAIYCTLHPGMDGTIVVSDSADVTAVAGSGTTGSTRKGSDSASAATGTPDKPDDTLKNVWMLVWGAVALVGVVALPLAVFGMRPPRVEAGSQ